MKIIAWNVNGIRSLIKKNDLDELLNKEDPDILCLGETKLSNDFDFNSRFDKYEYKYWNYSKIKKGYSGSAIFSKFKPEKYTYGLNNNKFDDLEGRVITLEFTDFYLIHVYTPNSGVSLNRLEWRINTWDKIFNNYIYKLQKIKPIIVCGDLNVAHNEIDLKNPSKNLKTAGFTIDERNSFTKILDKCKLVDTYRYFYPNEIKYSFWSYMSKARLKNIGWRIDYFLISKNLLEKKINEKCYVESNILTDIKGSDHAPIILII